VTTHSTLIGYFFWLLFGWFGVHRFYFGKRLGGALFALAFAAVSAAWLIRHFTLHDRPGAPGLIGFAAIAAAWLIDGLLVPRMRRQSARRYQVGRYSYTVAWLLLVLLGVLGAHRFYLRRWGTAVLYLCSLGVFGLGIVYDLFVLNDALSDANEAWISDAPQVRGSRVG
jgi:TM2 domain-containing membrane protein YozV